MVNVLVPGGVALVGLIETVGGVAPVGPVIVAVKFTVPANPLIGTMETVDVPVLPEPLVAFTAIVDGDAESEKSAAQVVPPRLTVTVPVNNEPTDTFGATAVNVTSVTSPVPVPLIAKEPTVTVVADTPDKEQSLNVVIPVIEQFPEPGVVQVWL